MEDKNYFDDIEKNFGYIGTVLNSIREESTENTGNLNKALSNISNQLDLLSDEESTNLIKIFLNELKKSLEEKHNFVSAKFDEIESSFEDLAQKSDKQLKAEEIKELFDIIATNLNVFSRDFSAQKDIISEINLQLDALKQDDSQKKEIIKNISLLKADLDKFSNGFESIILNLNTNFKEVFNNLVEIDAKESLGDIKKDIESIFLSSNAVLSTLQMIDHKNRELEEVLTSVVTKEDFNLEREQVARLIEQNSQIAEFISTLPKESNLEELSEKVETTVVVINALKNMLQDTSQQNQKILSAQLESLETKILNISTEEEFIGFRKELGEFVKEVINSTNLMREDLNKTNVHIKDVVDFFNSLDIETKIEEFSEATKESEENIKASLNSFSNSLAESLNKNAGLVSANLEDGIKNINGQLENIKQDLSENSKMNVSTILENLQGVINNIFSAKNSLVVESSENKEELAAKINEIKEKISESKNFVVESSQQNLESILANVETVFQEVYSIKENINETAAKQVENIARGYNEVSKKIVEIKEDLNLSTEESTSKMLAIFDDFSKEIQGAKDSLKEASQEGAQEVKSFLEELSEKFVVLQDAIIQNSQINASDIKQLIEQVGFSVQNTKNFFEQSSSSNYSNLKSDIEELSQSISLLQNDFEIKSRSNFETISQTLSLLPDKISENQAAFENEQRTLIEENSNNLQNMSEKIQNLIKNLVAQENPFKNDVLNNFLELQSLIKTTKEALCESNASLGEHVSKEISEGIENIETRLSQFSEKYNLTVFNLQNRLEESLNNLQSVHEQGNFKLENSLQETYEIRAEIQTILKNISILSDDSAMSDLASELKQRFEQIIQNLAQLGDVLDTKNEASVQKTINTLEAAFSSISQNLNEYKNTTKGDCLDLLASLEEKSQSLNSQISLALTDILTTLGSNKTSVLESLSLIGENIQKILETDYDSMVSEIKNNIDAANSAIVSSISQNLQSENIQQINSLKSSFEALGEKLDELNLKASANKSELSVELSGILQKIEEINFGVLSEISNLQNDSRALIIDELQNNTAMIRNICASTESAISSTIENTANETEEKLIEKITEIQSDFSQKQGSNKAELLSSIEENMSEIKELSSANKSALTDLITSSIESAKENITELKETSFSNKTALSELITSSIDLAEENLFGKFESSQDKTETALSEIIIKSSQQTEIKLFEKIETTKNRLEQIQENAKSIILKEFQESAESIREQVASFEIDEKFKGEFLEKVEALQNSFNDSSDSIEQRLSQSEDLYKTSSQSMLSDVKTSFLENVEDNIDELKSFIEIVDKNNNLPALLDDAKTNIEDKIKDLQQNLQESISSISVKEDLNDLKVDFEASLDNLFKDLQNDILNSINSSQTINDISNTSLEITRRIEDLKNSISDELLNRLDSLELGFDNQKRLFDDFKNEFSDMNINSTMEISKLLVETKEELGFVGEKIENFDVSDSLATSFEKSNQFLKEEFETINQKLDVISMKDDSEIEENVSKIKKLISSQSEVINQLEKLEKLDSLDDLKALSKLSKLDGLENISEKFKPLENLSKLDEVPAMKTGIQSTLKSFGNKLDALMASAPKEDKGSLELGKGLNNLKEELFENILEIFNQISFVVEAEEIKDFVEEKSEELKTSLGENFNNILSSLDMLHEKTDNVDSNCFNIVGEINKIKSKIEFAQSGIETDSDYSYTLQDVETDIAKLRLILNDIAKQKSSDSNDCVDFVGDFDSINENILSISSRTNKLLLNSDESYNVLKDNLNDFRNVIYQLEERIKYIDNTQKIDKIEKSLEKVHNLSLSSVNSDKIFNQTFMYLAQWVDEASESLENITDKISEVDSVKISVNELKKSMPKKTDIENMFNTICEKFERQQSRIDSLEEKMERILAEAESKGLKPEAKLNKKIDKIDEQLSRLTANIEKLTSYVD